MASSFAIPDNALKRAEELINVGQKQDALQVLHGLITSRRHHAWQKMHEKLMFKYVDLCVDLRKGRFAKDGLIQYRNICQQVNVGSLEEVIKYFMDLSTKKAEFARGKAEALEEALGVDDLEADSRPEDLMLSSVGGEKGKERSDRELVTPWFKFLWETYRTVLDILRNNSKLMALYADTAHRAFQFCKQYKRKREFRRLCEIIRDHLANLNKYKDQRDRPDLSAPENLHFYLDTRFEQLKVATELKLWQEAFRSVEDIYGLTSMVNKMPKTSLMATYYAKLTDIFWVSSSHLYHAYAWFKLFQLQKSFNKNLSQKDLQLIASSVLLAALAAPPYDYTKTTSHIELEHEKERNKRMCNLIGCNIDVKPETSEVLSRSTLLMDLVSKGVMTYVIPEVKELYHLLENEFPPLDLASKVQPLLTKISKLGGKLSSASSVPEVQLSQYVPALEKVATLRLLQQVSHVYQTMKVETLTKMVPFFDFSAVERILVDAVKHNFVAMKVDHRKGAIIFGDLGFESDHLQGHLNVFAENLNRSRSMMFPSSKKGSKLSDMLPSLGEIIRKEHKRLLARKSIIEKRKEEQERQLIEMEREEETKRLHQHKKAEEAERIRLEAESKERKQQRILRDIEERKREEAEALLNDVMKLIKKNKNKPIIEGNVTKQTVMELALQQQVRERQEMEKKLQKLVKTMDHLERAKREEAAPLIEAAFHRRLAEEELLHECQNQAEIDLSRDSHDGKVREKCRLQRVIEHKIQFEERVINSRQADYDRLKAEREERLSQVLKARREERGIKRKMLWYVSTEKERLKKLHEEEARKREGFTTLINRPSHQIPEPGITAPPPAPTPTPADAATTLGTSAGRYVPPWRRSEPVAQASALAPAPPAQSDRWTSRRKDDRGATPRNKW